MPKRQETHVDRMIGDNVQHYRECAGYTQGQVAHKLKISRQQVYKYETGTPMGASALYELSHMFDIPVEAFYKDID